MEIKVKYHADIDPIEKITVGDWIDLRCAEDVKIVVGESKLISLGVSMLLPKGYYAEVVPRSSTFKKYGIIMTNSIGIIDESYCGDNDIWRFPAYCVAGTLSSRTYKGFMSIIPKNERIAQFRIVKKMPELSFVTVDTLGNPDRGGFGTTGRS